LYLIAPRAEETGEASLSVVEAKKLRKKYEAMNRLRPNASNALNLAAIYFTVGEGELALQAMDGIVSAVEAPENAGAVPANMLATIKFNRGMFLRGYGRFEEARASINEAWALDKSSTYGAMGQAEELLRVGEWEKGWKLHNAARGTREGAALALGLPESVKFWDGKETPEMLLVINEGGAGDRINYSRYLPLLTERGINWKFFSFDEFAPFYERLPWIGKERLILESEKKEFTPYPTHWTTPFSLAGPLGLTPETIPPLPTPYTAAKNLRLERGDNRPVIGISWSANELFQGGLRIRSMTEGQMMRLVCCTADLISWVNVQHDTKAPLPVTNVPFETWQDTAALIGALDGMVSVDCGAYHLAGAMGKETLLLTSANSDPKFFGGRYGEKDMWYPSVTQVHNGPSSRLHDMEQGIDAAIRKIRSGEWPKNKVTQN
jgi:hypothetical protein